jgi:autotransporter-associated beta strand protein
MKPLLFVSLPLLASALSLGAAVATWTGGPNGTATDFANAANWTPDAPAKGDTAQFSLPTAGQPVLDTTLAVAGLDFVTPEGGWTLSGAGTLTLGSAGLGCSGQTAGLNTVNLANLVLASGSTTLWTIFDNAVAPSASTLHVCSAIRLNPKGMLLFKVQRPNSGGVGTLKLTGPISGSSLGGVKYQGVGGLKKNQFVLTGNNSTYEGPTVLSQATITFDSLAATGSGSSFGSDGTVTVGDNNSFASAIYVGAGGATDRQWILGGNGGGSINNNGTGPIAFNSTESAIAGSGRRRLMLGGTNTAENIFAELLSDIGGVTAVVKNDSGTWVLANPANSYTGTNTFNGGTLQVSKLDLGGRPSCIGASTSGAENLSFYNAALDYTGAGDTCDRLFQVLGNTTINNNGSGALNFNNSGGLVTGGGGAHTLTLGGSYAGVNTFAPALGDNGATATSLTKRGATTWLLTGTNTYSGATTVRGGTLLIDGTLGSGPVLVTSGGTLGGNGGSIAGAVTIQDGGTLALGAAVSVLTVSDSLSFSATSTNVMKIAKSDGKASSDLVQGMNMVSFDGTLIVSASGEALASGDTFRLFKSGAFSGGAFAQLRLPELAAGLSWNTAALATIGTLSVAGPAGAPPAVIASQAPAAAVASATNSPAAVPASAPVAAAQSPSSPAPSFAVADGGPVTVSNGAVVRGPQGRPRVAILFSSCTANEETDLVLATLKSHKAQASFFVNSESLQWPMNQFEVRTILQAGHFVGPQSDSWKSLTKGPSLFGRDSGNYPEVAGHLKALGDLGVPPKDMRFFLARQEQANEAAAVRARACGLRMVTGTPGTLSLETTGVAGKRGFVTSQAVLDSILGYEQEHGLNGFMLLFRLDSGSRTTDKFSARFPELLDALQQRGYELVRVDELLDAQGAQ